jgi:hypothetical protein
MQSFKTSLNAIVFAVALINVVNHIHATHSHTHTKSIHGHSREVTFTSKLTDEKKGYSLIVTTYKPSKFKITINGHKLKDGRSLHIPVEDNKLLIRYDYEFNAMFKTFSGYREVEFELDPSRDHYSIDFSWRHENRFIIHHAKFIRITQIHEPGSEYAQ